MWAIRDDRGCTEGHDGDRNSKVEGTGRYGRGELMPKVICASLDCKYNGKGYQCTAKKINLSDNYIMTVNEGRQHFNKCRNYEMSEESKRIMNG